MRLSLMTLNLFFRIYYKFLLTKDLEELKENYEEMLDLVYDAGYRAVDVLSMEIQAMGAEYVKEQLDKRELSVSSFMYYGEFWKTDARTDPEVIQGGVEAVDMTVFLGSRVLMLIPQVREDLSGVDKTAIQGAYIRHFTPVANYAKEKGIHPVIEDTPNLQLHLCAAEDLKTVFSGVPGLEMVYDSGNMLLVKEDPVEYYKTFAEKIAHIHLKDMRYANAGDRRPDVSVDGVMMAAAASGMGMIDFRKVTAAIRESGYQGYLTIEFAMDDSNDYPGCLARTREYFEGMLLQE